jgi:hypothetical protein
MTGEELALLVLEQPGRYRCTAGTVDAARLAVLKAGGGRRRVFP